MRRLIGGPLDGAEVKFTTPELRVRCRAKGADLMALYAADVEDRCYRYLRTVETDSTGQPKHVSVMTVVPVEYLTIIDVAGDEYRYRRWVFAEAQE